ncbi:MAG: hypothetical protein LBK22_01180 [Tannerella sp.]|nr:hypothetical protein [Tannerella sp.]
MPQNHEELYSMAAQTVAYLTATVLARIGFAGAVLTWYQSEFMVLYNKFKTAFENWRNQAERTQVKTTLLQEAEDAFKKAYRKLYVGLMRENPLVMDDDLQSAGFPKRHTGGNTHAKVPSTRVELEADTGNPGEVIFHYHDAGAHGTGKPEGVHGMEMCYRVRAVDAPPAKNWKELTVSVFSTHPPLKLKFEGDQRTMILEYSSRWENTRGEKGPWNTIQWLVIP